MIGGRHVSEKVIRVQHLLAGRSILPFLLLPKPTCQLRPGLTDHLSPESGVLGDFQGRGDSSRCRIGLPFVGVLKRSLVSRLALRSPGDFVRRRPRILHLWMNSSSMITAPTSSHALNTSEALSPAASSKWRPVLLLDRARTPFWFGGQSDFVAPATTLQTWST